MHCSKSYSKNIRQASSLVKQRPYKLRSLMYTSFEDLLATSKYGFFNKMTSRLVCFIVFLLGGATVIFLATCLSGLPSIIYYQQQDVQAFFVYNCIFIGQILGYLSLGCVVDTNGRLSMLNFGLFMLPMCLIGVVLSSNITLSYTSIVASSALFSGLTVASRVYYVEYSFVETRGRSYLSLAIAFSMGSSFLLLFFITNPSLLFAIQPLEIMIVFATVALFLFQASQFLHPSLRFLLYQRQRIGAYLRHIYTLNTIHHEKDYKIPRKVNTRKLIDQINLREVLGMSPQIQRLTKKTVSLFSREYLKQTLCSLLIATVVWVNTIHNDFMLINTVIYNAAKRLKIRSQVFETSYLTRELKHLTTTEVTTICVAPVLILFILRPLSDLVKRTSLLSSLVLGHASVLCLMYGLMRTNSISKTVMTGLMCMIVGLSTMSSIVLELIILENLPTKMRAVGFSIFKTMGMVSFMILFDNSLIALMSEDYCIMVNVMMLLIILWPISSISDQSRKPMVEFVRKELETPANHV